MRRPIEECPTETHWDKAFKLLNDHGVKSPGLAEAIANELAIAEVVASLKPVATAGDAGEIVKRFRRSSRGMGARDPAKYISGTTVAEAQEAADLIEYITAREAVLREALEKIAQWADAYPLPVFPEPDFKKAREVLESAGMTLDAISASNMRHVVKGVGEIARAALAGR